jgi:hypothetical protein
LYGFNISIGQPPISIGAALSVETPYLMVQSAECQTDVCVENNHTGFNSTLSETFEPTRVQFWEYFGLVLWQGYHAKDNINFAGITLPETPLLLADTVETQGWVGIDWYFDYDAVLGLSPHSPVWTALTESGAIENKRMGIKFPSAPLDYGNIGKRDDGELTLGGIHPDFKNATFDEFPLAEGDRAAYWATKISSITYTNNETRVHRDLPPSSIAAFTTAAPTIALPPGWAWLLYQQVSANVTQMVMGLPKFPCEMRDDMEPLTIGLGGGDENRNITLSAFEYTLHYWFREGDYEEESCLLAVVDGEQDVVRLGWPFLRKYYIVLDEEEARIQCKKFPMLNIHIRQADRPKVAPLPDEF